VEFHNRVVSAIPPQSTQSELRQGFRSVGGMGVEQYSSLSRASASSVYLLLIFQLIPVKQPFTPLTVDSLLSSRFSDCVVGKYNPL
jgi:hypothetical protein